MRCAVASSWITAATLLRSAGCSSDHARAASASFSGARSCELATVPAREVGTSTSAASHQQRDIAAPVWRRVPTFRAPRVNIFYPGGAAPQVQGGRWFGSNDTAPWSWFAWPFLSDCLYLVCVCVCRTPGSQIRASLAVMRCGMQARTRDNLRQTCTSQTKHRLHTQAFVTRSQCCVCCSIGCPPNRRSACSQCHQPCSREGPEKR